MEVKFTIPIIESKGGMNMKIRVAGIIRALRPIRPLREMPADKFTSWEDHDGEMRQGFAHATGWEILVDGQWVTQYESPAYPVAVYPSF